MRKEYLYFHREATILAIAAGVFGALWGFRQGMIMSMAGDAMHTGAIEGVRGHVWFGWYHAIGVVMMAAFVWTVAETGWTWRNSWQSGLVIAGTVLIAWELSEAGYTIARWGEFRLYEHLTLIDVVSIELRGWTALMAHTVRTAGGITFLMIGGKK